MLYIENWSKRDRLPDLEPGQSAFIVAGHEQEAWDRLRGLIRQRRVRHRLRFEISRAEVNGRRGAIIECTGFIPTLRDVLSQDARKVTDFLVDWDALPVRQEQVIPTNRHQAVLRSAARWNRLNHERDFVRVIYSEPGSVVAFRMGESLASYNQRIAEQEQPPE